MTSLCTKGPCKGSDYRFTLHITADTPGAFAGTGTSPGRPKFHVSGSQTGRRVVIDRRDGTSSGSYTSRSTGTISAEGTAITLGRWTDNAGQAGTWSATRAT